MKKTLMLSAAILATSGIIFTTSSITYAATDNSSQSFNVLENQNDSYINDSILSEKIALPHTTAPDRVPGGWGITPGHTAWG